MNRSSFGIFLLVLLICSCKKEQPKTHNQWKLNDADFQTVLTLSDTSTLTNLDEAGERLAEIQDVFSNIGDRRGAYPTILKAVTNYAISSFALENYKNTALMRAFYLDFVKRYLGALHEHLLGNKLEYHWDTYYRYAKVEHNVSRLVLEGINAHFSIDMARAVALSKLNKSNQGDWDKFGTETLDAVSSFNDELFVEYEVNAEEVFKLFFIGDLVNGLLGEGSATKFGYQMLRNEALSNGILLQLSTNGNVEQNMKVAFTKKDNVILALDKMQMLP